MIYDISIDKAKKEKLFYFVVTGIVYRENDQKCLILQRSKKEVAHPGIWGGVGGKLEWQDLQSTPPNRMNHDIPNWVGMAEDLLYRETKEECNLEVEDPRYLSSVAFVRPDNVPVMCIKYGVKYKSGEVAIPEDFEDFAWVSEEETKNYEMIEGIAEEIAQTIKLYSK